MARFGQTRTHGCFIGKRYRPVAARGQHQPAIAFQQGCNALGRKAEAEYEHLLHCSVA